VASGGRPIIESAAAFAALINTPDAKTHDAVDRPVSRHARNFVGAAYRADVSGGRNSHDTASRAITAGAIIAKRRVLSPFLWNADLRLHHLVRKPVQQPRDFDHRLIGGEHHQLRGFEQGFALR
jgi:hypothetical protein